MSTSCCFDFWEYSDPFAIDKTGSIFYNVVNNDMRCIYNMDSLKIAAYTRISVDTELDRDNTSIPFQIDKICTSE